MAALNTLGKWDFSFSHKVVNRHPEIFSKKLLSGTDRDSPFLPVTKRIFAEIEFINNLFLS